jgi:predicted house-cleaning noncanonical NTP pyrophosphatase (MazG superfamily)
VPAFFVVDKDSLEANQEEFESSVKQCLIREGMAGTQTMVRSSGVSETMRDRGRLLSAISTDEDVCSTIKRLAVRLAEQGISKVHWIVQEYVRPVRKGHLSNERRLSYEKRDWVAEIEPERDQPGDTAPVAVRLWREGTDVSNFDLRCSSELEITLRLKQVARWATRLSSRLHFEWVWSGMAVRIVQADIADPTGGVDPNSLRPADIPAIAFESLRVFKTASAADFVQYGKLRNAKIYKGLGYQMPEFFVLIDQATMAEILRGEISASLAHDLAELTKRPLIIRTDGTEIPQSKREMLPRSDELRSLAAAKDWLTAKFKPSIEANGLQTAALCLIAHHFIPSVSAAWARAEPGKRMVRVESLWGLPEGLYWYSHDTFEVDTQQNVPTASTDLPLRERLRYKGTFVAPDEEGRWVPRRTAVPHDWTRSISRRSWITEIAVTTRRVAEQENFPVVVMWFIDNDPRATRHSVLPWYHSRSKLDVPKAAPRRKLTLASDFRIETANDWKELKSQVGSGNRIERVVIEPKDPELIRSQEFAEELGDFAATHNIVVELAGGILSHAYYMLQRQGAQVECTDLFGADEDIIEYNKLVRDKVPAVIEGGGEDVEVVRLRGDALVTALRQKLIEEAFEALDAKSGDELIGELADVQEVIYGICNALQITPEQLDLERTKKLARRGGFDNGVMLKRTSLARSLSHRDNVANKPAIAVNPDETPTQIIVEPAAIPSTPPYRRADMRNVDQRPEKLLTFETEANKIGTVKETTSFTIPIERESRHFTLTVELTRSRSSLRGTVSLRLEPSQLEIELRESGTSASSQTIEKGGTPVMRTPYWVIPCTACTGVHGLSQPMTGDRNPYAGKQIDFVCPVTGGAVTSSGDNVRRENIEAPFPALTFRLT